MTDVPGAQSQASTSVMEAGSSSNQVSTGGGERREAGPLPAKVGEFGYQPPSEPVAGTGRSTDVDVPHPLSPRGNRPVVTPTSSTTATANSTTDDMPSKDTVARICGIRVWTIVQFFFFLATLICTIVGWVLVATHFHPSSTPSAPAGTNPDNLAQPSEGMAMSGLVFIHVAFAVGALLQLIILDRTVFQMRAERRAFFNPLDAQANLELLEGGGFVTRYGPWHRSVLPSYAAALGVRGTGDVEDVIIAGPAPPEYGNTRGSTLLLANLLRRSSRGSIAMSLRRMRSGLPSSDSREGTGTTAMAMAEREISEDAARARRLEEALARLDGPQAAARAQVQRV